MGNADARRLRSETIPKARGEVLEVGIGSGRNLEYYSPAVQRVCGVDPSMELQKMARARQKNLKVEFLGQPADQTLPLDDATFDTAVITWSLCTIPKPLEALREVRRVLKPEGQLLFIEHGQSPEAKVAAWQDRLTPIFKPIGGGCHLNRRVGELIVQSGFEISDLRTFHVRGPKPMTFTYQGTARPI